MSQQRLIKDEMSDKIINTAEDIAMTYGAEKVNVRKILEALHITNRVFYNRFRNMDEVLSIIYKKTVLRIREIMSVELDGERDFFAQITDIVANTLVVSYKVKKKLNRFVFQSDSASGENYMWWKSRIAGLIELGKARGYVGDVDTEKMSYAIWCFIRGYNADAIERGVMCERAVSDFKYCFGILLGGMKA